MCRHRRLYNPKSWYGPNPKNLSKEFFDATVENCRRIIDEIKPKRTRFTIEMKGWNIPDGPDSYLDLIRAVDRPAFGVHMDVCNGINSPTRFYRNAEYIKECFKKLGPWIISCHAKDLAWIVELNVHFLEVIPGRGEVDYGAYLRELSKLPVDAPLMLEHLKTAAEYEEGKQYIQKIAAQTGVTFDDTPRFARYSGGRVRRRSIPPAHPEGGRVQYAPEVDEHRRPLQARRRLRLRADRMPHHRRSGAGGGDEEGRQNRPGCASIP